MATAAELGAKTIKNSLFNLLGFAVSFLINFFSIPIVIGEIGMHQYGLFAVMFIFIAPLNLANMGFGEATVKFVAEHGSLGNFDRASKYIRNTLFLNLVVGVVGGLILAFSGTAIAVYSFDSISASNIEVMQRCFVWVALGWLTNQLSAVFMAVPAAMQKYRIVATGNLITSLINPILAIVLVKMGYGLEGFVSATFFANAAVYWYWFISSKRLMKNQRLYPKYDRETFKESFQFGGWHMLAQIGGLLAAQSEKFILGKYLSVKTLGIYNACLQMETKIYLVVFKLMEVLFPLFSSSSTKSEDKRMRMLLFSGWTSSLLSSALLLPLVPLSYDLLLLYLKSKETAEIGSLVLAYIVVGGTIGSASNSSYFYLLGNNRTKQIAWLAGITGIVTLATSWALVPIYGIRVAAVSVITAMIAQAIFLSWTLYTMFEKRLQFKAIFVNLYLPIFVGLGFMLAATHMVEWHSTNWIMLMVSYSGWMLAIGLSMVLVGLLTKDGRTNIADAISIFKVGMEQVRKK
ncbi:MAG: hypothetical protein EXR21_06030 [Flavobacteriaceae bacterium]|nr:hypothetical protein [Flavobacteriaceae bacterium]